MMDTVTVHGTTYRLGADVTPVALDAVLPATIPGWQEVDGRPWSEDRTYGRVYLQTSGGLRALITAAVEDDRRRWLHVSLSHRGGRLPNWREMCEAKAAFCGAERAAYQIHPPASKGVNIHPACLHLWCPLDGPVTPDFTHGGETI